MLGEIARQRGERTKARTRSQNGANGVSGNGILMKSVSPARDGMRKVCHIAQLDQESACNTMQGNATNSEEIRRREQLLMNPVPHRMCQMH
jgi:hypothetical protein